MLRLLIVALFSITSLLSFAQDEELRVEPTSYEVKEIDLGRYGVQKSIEVEANIYRNRHALARVLVIAPVLNDTLSHLSVKPMSGNVKGDNPRIYFNAKDSSFICYLRTEKEKEIPIEGELSTKELVTLGLEIWSKEVFQKD